VAILKLRVWPWVLLAGRLGVEGVVGVRNCCSHFLGLEERSSAIECKSCSDTTIGHLECSRRFCCVACQSRFAQSAGRVESSGGRQKMPKHLQTSASGLCNVTAFNAALYLKQAAKMLIFYLPNSWKEEGLRICAGLEACGRAA
jgi:hypothetical protein